MYEYIIDTHYIKIYSITPVSQIRNHPPIVKFRVILYLIFTTKLT